ncbi:MAG: methylated-DNA--[protein]-cysteine S-methyltransferase [Ignavibacteriales bacterium]|nr:methylated-DNA--[protein]-cysteine S-methyltransferase [Ignavibacteriales bacterium]
MTRVGELSMDVVEIGGVRFFIYVEEGRLARLSMNAPAKDYPTAPKKRTTTARATAKQLREYFAGKRREFDLPLKLEGTPFRERVWRELRKIPYGKTASYGELARKTGGARMSRAVGGAVGANPIPVVVPCHRVVRSDGSLGGFSAAGGREKALALKRKLLRVEIL